MSTGKAPVAWQIGPPLLQKALLQQYTPKQVVMVRGLAEDMLVRQVEMIDRMCFGFAGLFGVRR